MNLELPIEILNTGVLPVEHLNTYMWCSHKAYLNKRVSFFEFDFKEATGITGIDNKQTIESLEFLKNEGFIDVKIEKKKTFIHLNYLPKKIRVKYDKVATKEKRRKKLLKK